jgi:hypothetical protein
MRRLIGNCRWVMFGDANATPVKIRGCIRESPSRNRQLRRVQRVNAATDQYDV